MPDRIYLPSCMSWHNCLQILQRAAAWCPNAEKVFVSPTGQVVDPAAVQQQDLGKDESQSQGNTLSSPSPSPPPPRHPPSVVRGLGPSRACISHELHLKGGTNKLHMCDNATAVRTCKTSQRNTCIKFGNIGVIATGSNLLLCTL